MVYFSAYCIGAVQGAHFHICIDIDTENSESQLPTPRICHDISEMSTNFEYDQPVKVVLVGGDESGGNCLLRRWAEGSYKVEKMLIESGTSITTYPYNYCHSMSM